MGANESTSLLPYPPSWLPSTTTPVQHRQAVAALKSLSSVEPERFLAVRAPLPELEAALWDFNDYRERASAAEQRSLAAAPSSCCPAGGGPAGGARVVQRAAREAQRLAASAAGGQLRA